MYITECLQYGMFELNGRATNRKECFKVNFPLRGTSGAVIAADMRSASMCFRERVERDILCEQKVVFEC
jgi:hypothetical protein